MAKVYLGETEIAPVVETPVPEKKYGLSVENLLPTFTDTGIVQSTPAENVVLNPTEYADNLFSYMFAKNRGNAKNITVGGLTEINKLIPFTYFANTNIFIENITFATLVSVTGGVTSMPFNYAFSGCYAHIRFPKLKTVGSYGLSSARISVAYMNTIEEVFPVLEEINGNSALANGVVDTVDTIHRFISLKSVSCPATYSSSATFNGWKAHTYYFPVLESISGDYIFPTAATEIHFPAASQEAIEASTGYATKWGATNATIYFDL